MARVVFIGGKRPHLLNLLDDAGMAGNLRGCWDPGSILSYDTGVSSDLLDFRPTPSARDWDPRDAVFSGTEGGLRPSEAFVFDGTSNSYLLMATAGNWAVPFHEDGAVFTAGGMVYLPSAANSGGFQIIPVFSAFGHAGGIFGPLGTLIEFADRTSGAAASYQPGNSGPGTGDIDTFAISIGNGGTIAFSAGVDVPSNRLDKWNYWSVSIDESIGASGCSLRLNQTVTNFTSTYASPAEGGGIPDYAIGLRYTRNDGGANNRRACENSAVGPFFTSGSRYTTEQNTLYARLKSRRAYTDLP